MEYSISQLAKLSGLTTRTLRYYDEIDLLKPGRTAENGYRVYGPEDVDLLQQILFFRELGVQLQEISRLLSAPDFDKKKALEAHLSNLYDRKNQIELLIENVRKTIRSFSGDIIMSDNEKFAGFK